MSANKDTLLSRTSATSDMDSATSTVDTTTVSRFEILKKKPFNDRNNKKGPPAILFSYNSDFLSARFNSPGPLKKRRVSFQAPSHRSRASCMNLLAQSQSKGIDEISELGKEDAVSKNQESLAYQLDCPETQELATSNGALAISAIASIPPTNKGKKVTKAVAALAFPNLSSTVSDSSCESKNVAATGLTRERYLVPPGPAPEIAASQSSSGSKDSFGWFVDLDDNEEASAEDFVPPTISDKNASSQDLAFQAPTAPKRATNHVQEEMEQAYAADTIDSVLGDLF